MTTSRYARLLAWHAEDACWVVTVPELPGCMAHGATLQDAVTASEAAIRAWISTALEDGLEVPTPQDPLMSSGA